MKDLKKNLQEKRYLYLVMAKKDPQAFAALYDLYVEKIFRFVLLKIDNREEAQDVTSEVFLKVWHYLIDAQKKDISSMSGLLYATARRLVIDTYRMRAKQKTCSIEYAETLVHNDGMEELAQKQEIATLLKSIKQLKQEYQEVVLLRYIDGMSLKEIAEILQKKPTNVRVLLHRAQKKLQSLYDDRLV
ncbi:RNA polymerase sigma factor [Patescibacteria group bacterium]|nr:RNA polymerase sigma factor [Patescibacteria group bacterium]MBU1722131.1 RNA polymerase sigma factor [Patescibacteria group bacterium]MBU1901180.1 RNA polymerase sigma factor [Patescibacteria group bacterium]